MAGEPSIDPARLRTPRAAAVAGIVFALLLGTSYVMLRLAIPAAPTDNGEWIEENAATVAGALGLISFAGIAFLWFMGVVRDRIGRSEDQFFSTVFFGSGLLFVALMFVSAAIASAMLASYGTRPDEIGDSNVYRFARDLMYRSTNTYGMRMASVFMISLGTIWVRTRTMPRWLAIVTYAAATVLLVTLSLSLWVSLVFPGWVLLISVYILVTGMRPLDAAMPEDGG